MMIKQAVDNAELLGEIVGLMDEQFTVEGAIYWLLDENPLFANRSAAWLLLNGDHELVLDVLSMLSDLEGD